MQAIPLSDVGFVFAVTILLVVRAQVAQDRGSHKFSVVLVHPSMPPSTIFWLRAYTRNLGLVDGAISKTVSSSELSAPAVADGILCRQALTRSPAGRCLDLPPARAPVVCLGVGNRHIPGRAALPMVPPAQRATDSSAIGVRHRHLRGTGDDVASRQHLSAITPPAATAGTALPDAVAVIHYRVAAAHAFQPCTPVLIAPDAGAWAFDSFSLGWPRTSKHRTWLPGQQRVHGVLLGVHADLFVDQQGGTRVHPDTACGQLSPCCTCVRRRPADALFAGLLLLLAAAS
jgi:hypothetical protein